MVNKWPKVTSVTKETRKGMREGRREGDCYMVMSEAVYTLRIVTLIIMILFPCMYRRLSLECILLSSTAFMTKHLLSSWCNKIPVYVTYKTFLGYNGDFFYYFSEICQNRLSQYNELLGLTNTTLAIFYTTMHIMCIGSLTFF